MHTHSQKLNRLSSILYIQYFNISHIVYTISINQSSCAKQFKTIYTIYTIRQFYKLNVSQIQFMCIIWKLILISLICMNCQMLNVNILWTFCEFFVKHIAYTWVFIYNGLKPIRVMQLDNFIFTQSGWECFTQIVWNLHTIYWIVR